MPLSSGAATCSLQLLQRPKKKGAGGNSKRALLKLAVKACVAHSPFKPDFLPAPLSAEVQLCRSSLSCAHAPAVSACRTLRTLHCAARQDRQCAANCSRTRPHFAGPDWTPPVWRAFAFAFAVAPETSPFPQTKRCQRKSGEEATCGRPFAGRVEERCRHSLRSTTAVLSASHHRTSPAHISRASAKQSAKGKNV
eukprot:3921882-Rhodomonas_salina.1